MFALVHKKIKGKWNLGTLSASETMQDRIFHLRSCIVG